LIPRFPNRHITVNGNTGAGSGWILTYGGREGYDSFSGLNDFDSFFRNGFLLNGFNLAGGGESY
jgi:hypothetical protein